MASGEASSGQNVDPTSTNTSFDNNFNFKDLFIEKAYASYTPAWFDAAFVDQATFKAGKIDNPFEKGSSDIIWDRDVKPEGASEQFAFKKTEMGDTELGGYFTAGQFVLDEDGTSGGDAELFGYQLGFNAVAYTPFLERPVDWLSAVSYYSYQDYAKNNNFLIGTTSLARGNSTCGTSLCSGDFGIWEFYNEVAFYPSGLPVRPYFDFAANLADDAFDSENKAWALGVKVGGIQKKGDWELGLAYKRIEPESVVGAFNDSDFGLGHSGKRGSVFKLGYALTDSITLGGAAFFVNNLTTGTGGVRDEEQRRFQLDLAWKF